MHDVDGGAGHVGEGDGAVGGFGFGFRGAGERVEVGSVLPSASICATTMSMALPFSAWMQQSAFSAAAFCMTGT